MQRDKSIRSKRTTVGIAGALFLIFLVGSTPGGCGDDTTTTSGGGGSGGGTQYCNTGYCYSYLEQICCPRSAPYACHGQCYTYSGGGGCADYRTTCY